VSGCAGLSAGTRAAPCRTVPGRAGLSVPLATAWCRVVPPGPAARAAPAGAHRVGVLAVVERMPATVGDPAAPAEGPPAPEGVGERGVLTVDDFFAPVPEWVLDAAVSDCAVRLFAVLLRYGQSSGARMPSRATLARRLRKGSTDTVDRAMRELVALGAVVVERRRAQGVNQTNRYHLRTHHPDGGTTAGAVPGCAAVTPAPQGAALGLPGQGGGRSDAATPPAGTGLSEPVVPVGAASCCSVLEVGVGGGRRDAASGRTDAAGVAAGMRPDPELLTHRQPHPPTPPADAIATDADPGCAEPASAALADAGGPRFGRGPVSVVAGDRLSPLEQQRAVQLAQALGLDAAALTALVTRCQQLRADAGLMVGRWTLRCVLAALQAALQRGRPPDRLVPALLGVAADPGTRSPMRLAEAGPWWDPPARTPLQRTHQEQAELDELEGFLADRDDRAWLQAQARALLAEAGEPVDRLGVARRARRLADRHHPDQPGAAHHSRAS